MLYYWSKEFLKPISIIATFDPERRMVHITETREDYKDFRDARIFDVDVYSYRYSELFYKRTVSWQVALVSVTSTTL